MLATTLLSTSGFFGTLKAKGAEDEAVGPVVGHPDEDAIIA